MSTQLAKRIEQFLAEQESVAWSIDKIGDIYEDDTVEAAAFRLLKEVSDSFDEDAVEAAQNYWLNS